MRLQLRFTISGHRPHSFCFLSLSLSLRLSQWYSETLHLYWSPKFKGHLPHGVYNAWLTQLRTYTWIKLLQPLLVVLPDRAICSPTPINSTTRSWMVVSNPFFLTLLSSPAPKFLLHTRSTNTICSLPRHRSQPAPRALLTRRHACLSFSLLMNPSLLFEDTRLLASQWDVQRLTFRTLASRI